MAVCDSVDLQGDLEKFACMGDGTSCQVEIKTTTIDMFANPFSQQNSKYIKNFINFSYTIYLLYA